MKKTFLIAVVITLAQLASAADVCYEVNVKKTYRGSWDMQKGISFGDLDGKLFGNNDLMIYGGEKYILEDDSMGIPADEYTLNTLVRCHEAGQRLVTSEMAKLEGKQSTQLVPTNLIKAIVQKQSQK